jgi:hypothetical protein
MNRTCDYRVFKIPRELAEELIESRVSAAAARSAIEILWRDARRAARGADCLSRRLESEGSSGIGQWGRCVCRDNSFCA